MNVADTSASSTQSIAQRVTLLEMKELHERQRAQHAVDMHEQARAQLTQALQRNTELETNVDTLTTTALQLQKEEQALKDQLNGWLLLTNQCGNWMLYRQCTSRRPQGVRSTSVRAGTCRWCTSD